MSKRRNAIWAGPFGASLLIAAIPGPCTTFDDASLAADAAPDQLVDAGPYVAKCGIGFAFVGDGGDGDGGDCQEIFDTDFTCCGAEQNCAKVAACKQWVETNNACKGDAACVVSLPVKAGVDWPGYIMTLETCVDERHLQNSCLWPSPDSSF